MLQQSSNVQLTETCQNSWYFLSDTIKTRQEHKAWKEWRASELERDIEYCHPRWQQEAQYVDAEIKAVRNLSLMSSSDHWIYFDWVALFFILATIVSHMAFFHYSNNLSKEIHHNIVIPLLLILWFRIFKYARPFEGAGPFIVIFGSVLGDIIKWGIFIIIVFIPFVCAFWLTFGYISSTPVEGYDEVSSLVYNIFSMIVGNDHNFLRLERTKPFMARLLCGSFITIASIIALNLLIALLTNTFERLYANAVANAVMQRARTILLLEKSLWQKQEKKYYSFITNHGSPEVISKNVGRLLSLDKEDQASTIEQVRDDVKGIAYILAEKFGKRFRKGKKSDLDFVKTDVTKVRRFQEEIVVDVRNMKLSLEDIKRNLQQIITNTKLITNKKKKKSMGEGDSSTSSDSSSSSSSEDENSNNDQELKETNATQEENSKIAIPKAKHAVIDRARSEGESSSKSKVKPQNLRNSQASSKTLNTNKPRIERSRNSYVGELQRKFEERSSDTQERRKYKTKKKSEQTNGYESSDRHMTTYTNDVPRPQLTMENFAYPPYSFHDMLQQMNTSSSNSFPQPYHVPHHGDTQMKHVEHQIGFPRHSEKPQSHQVILPKTLEIRCCSLGLNHENILFVYVAYSFAAASTIRRKRI